MGPTRNGIAALTPDNFLAACTRIVVETAKDLWRSEPLSEAEMGTITDRILLLAERKEETHGSRKE